MRVPAVLERFRPWWPGLRAAFVGFHLFAIVLSAIPAPAGGMNRRNWKDPTVQGEFRAWGNRLGVDPATLEETLFGFASGWMQARDLWLAPVTPYLDVTGTDQPWRMFVAPHRHPARFRVEVQSAPAADWELLFEERSDDAHWRRDFFDAERTRSVLFRYAWPEYSREGRQLCSWIAGEVFAERAEVQKVRCRYWKAPSPSPEEAASGAEIAGTFMATKTVTRREKAGAAP
jgi:hypothetical protein